MRYIHHKSDALMLSNLSCVVVVIDEIGETQMMEGEERNTPLFVERNDDSFIQATPKKVSFAIHNLETTREIPNCLDSSEEDLNKIWNTATEAFHDSLDAAHYTAHLVLREHQGILECLEDTRKKADDIARSILTEDTMSMVLTRLDVSSSGLLKWSIEHDFRGLEGRTSSLIRHGKKRCRRARCDIVFDSSFCTDDEVCQRYQATSRPARLWAKMVGQADHLAALEIYREMDDQQHQVQLAREKQQTLHTVTNKKMTMSRATSFDCSPVGTDKFQRVGRETIAVRRH